MRTHYQKSRIFSASLLLFPLLLPHFQSSSLHPSFSLFLSLSQTNLHTIWAALGVQPRQQRLLVGAATSGELEKQNKGPNEPHCELEIPVIDVWMKGRHRSMKMCLTEVMTMHLSSLSYSHPLSLSHSHSHSHTLTHSHTHTQTLCPDVRERDALRFEKTKGLFQRLFLLKGIGRRTGAPLRIKSRIGKDVN